MSKFSAEIPKGDGWGVESVVADAAKRIQRGEKSPLIPVVGVIDVKELKIDPETHNVVAVVRVRRLEALDSLERIRAWQKVLLEQAAARVGQGDMLPFELTEMIEQAFGGIDVGQIEQDEAEKKADDEMTDIDRLRKHLEVVHGMATTAFVDSPDHEVTKAHDLDHDRLQKEVDAAAESGTEPPTDAHDRDWWAWRRVDLEAAEEDEAADGEDLQIEIPDSPEGLLPFEETKDDDEGSERPDNN